MASIAFIGLGNMGGPMAANLVKGGRAVTAFDLVAASRDQVRADGAGIADSAVAAVKGAEVVITTSAPASRYLMTSSALSTPVLAASDALSRPERTPIQSRGRRISAAVLSSRFGNNASRVRSMSGW